MHLITCTVNGQIRLPIQPTGSAIITDDALRTLKFHNKVRRDVGVAPLEWSRELSAYAQQWAQHLATNGCKLVHRSAVGANSNNYGENIFWGQGTFFDAEHASESWYSEIKDFSSNNWDKAGHYTQMVWKTTRMIGVGVAVCLEDKGVIIVANYDPPGNYVGQNPY